MSLSFPDPPDALDDMNKSIHNTIRKFFVKENDKVRGQIIDRLNEAIVSRHTTRPTSNKYLRRIQRGRDTIDQGGFLVLAVMFGTALLSKRPWYRDFESQHRGFVRRMPRHPAVILPPIPVFKGREDEYRSREVPRAAIPGFRENSSPFPDGTDAMTDPVVVKDEEEEEEEESVEKRQIPASQGDEREMAATDISDLDDASYVNDASNASDAAAAFPTPQMGDCDISIAIKNQLKRATHSVVRAVVEEEFGRMLRQELRQHLKHDLRARRFMKDSIRRALDSLHESDD